MNHLGAGFILYINFDPFIGYDESGMCSDEEANTMIFSIFMSMFITGKLTLH